MSRKYPDDTFTRGYNAGRVDEATAQRAELERLKAENAALRAKPCSRCGLWPEPKDPCADMACPAGAKP